MVIIVTIALFFIQIQYSVNERTVRSLAEDKINIISRVIQVSIDEIHEITVTILSDPEIQQFDSSLSDPRDVQLHLQNVANLFSSYQIFKPYMETFYIRFNEDLSLSIGKVQEMFDGRFVEEREPELRALRGRPVIYPYPDDRGRYILSREIRKIKNLDQSHIASLHLVIDFEKWFDIYFRKYGIQNMLFFLQQSDGSIYCYEDVLDTRQIGIMVQQDSGVYRIGKEYFYLHSASIDNAGWKVFVLLPFTQIVNVKNLLMYGSIIGLLAGLTCLILWGRNWSRRITQPIVQLADKMAELQETDFTDRNHQLPVYNRKDDEIAVLYENFDRLLKKVDHLINENYRKQLLLKDTQLQNLIAQINPHFIYNTLDTISWMALGKETKGIPPMVQSLAKLLRASISAENIISLTDEVELLKGYLNIQKNRFQERLQYVIQQGAVPTGCMVPGMILQPVVENSIKYSLDIPKSAVHIQVSIEADDDSLILTVTDDGPGISENRLQEIAQDRAEKSIGLGNIRNRLAIFYGKRGSLEIQSSPGEGTRVRIRLPLIMEGRNIENL